MKVMICQPMNGRTEQEIHAERNKAIERLHKMHIEIIDNFFEDEVTEADRVDIYLLSKSLLKMCEADAVLFIGKWREARGCRIEHQVALDYGVKILYDDFIEDPKEQKLTRTYDYGSSITINTPNTGITTLKPGDITYDGSPFGKIGISYDHTTTTGGGK